MIQISFPDGSKKEYKAGINAFEIAKSISPSLAKSALYAKVNGGYWDLSRSIETNAEVQILTLKDAETLPLLRHSLAHVLAEAVKELWPDAKPVIGPDVADGFYYDFDLEHHISTEDFSKIEAKMKTIIKRGDKVERQVLSRDEAIALFKKLGEPYKVDNIKRVPLNEDITCYKQGNFIDLCRGPHVNSTSKLPKSFKIARVAGAYLHGDSKQKMLQRVYVYAFENKEKLENHLYVLEEAEKRNHKKIGKELELIHFDPLSPGAAYWLPNGLAIYKELYNFWSEYHRKCNYKEYRGPLLNSKKLFEISGHWQHYNDDMFKIEKDENTTYALKPMGCPNAMVAFNLKTKSYNDLPYRLSDSDMLYRNESTGALNGLFRGFEFNQDDAHIFISEDQIEDEYNRIIKILDDFYGMFGLKYTIKLSTRPDDFMGEIETWNKAEEILEKILIKRFGKNGYGLKEKDGAFYGPKLDVQMTDCLGREWQTGTIQLDFQLPGKFDCKYTDKNGELKTPAVIHRVIYGSLGRFIGILIEHYAGKFPTWLAPIQIMVVPVSEKHIDYAKEIYDKLFSADVKTATHGLRVELDDSNERMGKKLRNASLKKIPYILIVGDNEIENKTVSIRKRDGEQENNIQLETFLESLKTEIETRK